MAGSLPLPHPTAPTPSPPHSPTHGQARPPSPENLALLDRSLIQSPNSPPCLNGTEITPLGPAASAWKPTGAGVGGCHLSPHQQRALQGVTPTGEVRRPQDLPFTLRLV